MRVGGGQFCRAGFLPASVAFRLRSAATRQTGFRFANLEHTVPPENRRRTNPASTGVLAGLERHPRSSPKRDAPDDPALRQAYRFENDVAGRPNVRFNLSAESAKLAAYRRKSDRQCCFWPVDWSRPVVPFVTVNNRVGTRTKIWDPVERWLHRCKSSPSGLIRHSTWRTRR